MSYILAFVILSANGLSINSFTAEYNSKQACEEAKELNRQQLSRGSVILATCTAKGK